MARIHHVSRESADLEAAFFSVRLGRTTQSARADAMCIRHYVGQGTLSVEPLIQAEITCHMIANLLSESISRNGAGEK